MFREQLYGKCNKNMTEYDGNTREEKSQTRESGKSSDRK